jgi:MoaA/NifB/PqqE/SkfB family radical SAM enzyme
MSVLIGGVVTHQNLRSKDLEDLIKLANSLGAVFLFNIATPSGHWHDNQAVLLRADDRDYLYKLMHKYPLTSTDHEPNRNEVGCPAGTEKIYITPYGDVIPCPFIHLSFGNVRQTSLIEIVQKMRKVSQFGSYPKICVAGEDREFHQKVMLEANKLAVQKHTPVPAERFYGKL